MVFVYIDLDVQTKQYRSKYLVMAFIQVVHFLYYFYVKN